MAEYIDRTQAIDAIEVHMCRQDPDDRGVYPLEDWQREQNYAYDLAMEILGNLPAADVVEVRHGEWIIQNSLVNGVLLDENEVFACSACQEQRTRRKYNYCPNCGAKMDDNVIQHTESVGNALGALDEVEELSRYIDANKKADELSKVPWYERKDEKQAVRMVKEFPTADVVEVVRCRECKHYNDKLEMYADCVCTIRHYCDGSPIIVGEDDFCSSGKRKDGGQDE